MEKIGAKKVKNLEKIMENKICMITGANSGIGKETARALANLGAIVILVCRNKEKGMKVLGELKKDTESQTIELMIADLEKPQSLHDLSNKFQQKYDNLDILINNAGLIIHKRELTEQGYERTIAINHLGHFLLTGLLLNSLKKSKAARIINVPSTAHFMGKIDFEDLMGEKKYTQFGAYGNSKLANILFTYELSKKLSNIGISVNALHPGVARSGFGKEWFGTKIFYNLFFPFTISAKKGAKTSVYLASSPDVEGITGKYFSKCKPKKSSKLSYDEDSQKKLWKISEELTGISY